LKKLLVGVAASLFCLVFLGYSPVFAWDANSELEGLKERIEQLEKKIEKQEEKTEGLLDRISENITFSGAIELDYSYADPRSIEDKDHDDSTSDLDVGTVEFGAEVKFHEWVTGNFLLKGEELDGDDDRVFWDEVTITIQKEGFPLYFVGGKRTQPFGVFNTHTINDPITQDCYEICKSGATLGFTYDPIGLDISATVYKGEELMGHLEEAEYGNERNTAGGYEETDDVSSWIGNITIAPVEGLTLAAYFDSETGDGDNNETAGGMFEYQIGVFTIDAEYIGAINREDKGDGEEHKESAWLGAVACQVMDPLEIALRYEGYDDDISGDQDGHLEDRYILGVNYTLFEKDDFATTLMLEYRRSNYEKESGNADDEMDEVFARLAIEF
jgi:hypothetical protein